MGNRSIPFERLRNEMAIADHHLDFALALSGAAVRRNAASGSTRTFKSL